MHDVPSKLTVGGTEVAVIRTGVLIIGSGAAALSCAINLKRMGVGDLLVVTDNRNGGTSRNTGSDKQTYYRLGDATQVPDSPYEMVSSYLTGGSMHGDIAFIEAQNSPRAFYNLVSMGVPFPHNRYGGFTGYKTDHDMRMRGTSLGPFTSKVMVERMMDEVKRLHIPLEDRKDVVRLLVEGTRAVGALVLDKSALFARDSRFSLILADHVVLGTGGPAGFYEASIYPRVHVGSIGLALEVGAQAVNLTESQFGIGTTKFRWNLSGSYQQVLPRYYSTEADGSGEQDFLTPYFSSWKQLTKAVFLKGYQWPFDASKVPGNGSSLIDLLVYHETKVRKRRVFIDYRGNLRGDRSWGPFTKDVVDDLAVQYLDNSLAWADRPIDRLRLLNPVAIELYARHGIDMGSEPMEIDVCAQHNNGGLYADSWWESVNIDRLYPIGEVNGSHGVSRPGGSALNSGQVGALRVAQRIVGYGSGDCADWQKTVQAIRSQVAGLIDLCEGWTQSTNGRDIARARTMLDDQLYRMRSRMSKAAGPIRSQVEAANALEEARGQLESVSRWSGIPPALLPKALRLRHMLIAQMWYLYAIERYIGRGGGSRGSYLVTDVAGDVAHQGLGMYKIKREMTELRSAVQVLGVRGGALAEWLEPCRPVPDESFWFERVWADFRSNAYLEGNRKPESEQ